MFVQQYNLLKHANYMDKLKGKIRLLNGECEFCGFQSVRFTRLVADSVHASPDIALDNSKFACPICADAFDLSRAHSKGKIVYLPEMTQAELNCLVYGAWAITDMVSSEPFDNHGEETISRKDSLIKNIEQLLTLLFKSRAKLVDSLFAYGASETYCASEPGELADCLSSFDSEKLSAITAAELFQSLKYLPYKESYSKERDYFKTALFVKLDYSTLHEMSKHFYTSLKSTNDLIVN